MVERPGIDAPLPDGWHGSYHLCYCQTCAVGFKDLLERHRAERRAFDENEPLKTGTEEHPDMATGAGNERCVQEVQGAVDDARSGK